MPCHARAKYSSNQKGPRSSSAGWTSIPFPTAEFGLYCLVETNTNLLQEEVAQTERAPAEAVDSQRKLLKVLLIEDNPDDAELIDIMISDAGADLFEVERVDKLEAALERLASGGIGIGLSDLA